MRVSGGAKLTFWDRGDYRGNMQLQEALSEARNRAVDFARATTPVSNALNDAQITAFNARVDERLAIEARQVRERFKTNWNNRPLWDLWDWISNKMPKNDPGSLTPNEVVQVMAYILQQNKMPAGKVALPPNEKTLYGIKIQIK